MAVKNTMAKGDFLSEKQKDLKDKIIKESLEAIFNNVKDNVLLFDNLQQLLDLHFSILIILNREVLAHIFKTSGAIDQRGKVMRNLFETIKNEVHLRIREAA